MATSHGSPPLAPVTLKFSVESKYTYLKTEDPPWTKRWVGGANQKAKRQAKAEQNHEGESAQAQLRMPAVYIRWPRADLPVHSDY